MNAFDAFKGCYNFGDNKLAQLHIDNKQTETEQTNYFDNGGRLIQYKSTANVYKNYFTYAYAIQDCYNNIEYFFNTCYIGLVVPHSKKISHDEFISLKTIK